MIAPARIAAYEILRQVSEGRADLPGAIADARAGLRDERDQALAADIATGVQRWRNTLDHVIASLSTRAIDRLDAEVVEILRLSGYQLLHLTRVPASAVVDDAVNLTGKVGKKSAAGLVNAVLRRWSRTRAALPLPPRPPLSAERDSALDYLSIALSHPRWLAARWHDRLGFERAEAWMTFNNRPAPLTLHSNTRTVPVSELQARLEGLGVATHRGRYAPDALVVEEGSPLRDPGVERGWFVAQDEASQLVTLLAGAEPKTPVLDACAAPGGKTIGMAAATAGLVVACDVRERRVALLARTIRQTASMNVRVVQSDLAAGLPFTDVFGTVVVDAPCSGLGTLRRDPDIRWRRTEADLPVFARAQRQMLAQAAHAVAAGGRLVYATCSSEPEENDAIVAGFLRDRPDFAAVDARVAHASLPRDTVDAEGWLRTEPDRHQLECFFGAVFERSR